MIKLRMFLFVFSIVSVAGCASTNAVKDSPSSSKHEDTVKLVRMTLTRPYMESFTRSFMQVLAQSFPSDSPEDKEIVRQASDVVADVLTENIPSLIEMSVPLYEKYFSHEEIRAMMEFYESPAGQKAIQVMPELTREAMQIGARWGEGLGPQVGQKLREKGIIE